MPTTYTPATGTPPVASYELPNDGEEVSFASLMTAIIEPLADGIAYLAANIGAAALLKPYTWTGVQTWQGANTHAGTETFSETVTQAKAPAYALGAAADADSTIDVSKPVWVAAAASSLRVDTMRSTTAPIPVTGQVVKIRMDPGGAAARRVSREGGTIIATLGNDATDPASVEVYWNGSVWKLLSYSAHVTPGTGA